MIAVGGYLCTAQVEVWYTLLYISRRICLAVLLEAESFMSDACAAESVCEDTPQGCGERTNFVEAMAAGKVVAARSKALTKPPRRRNFTQTPGPVPKATLVASHMRPYSNTFASMPTVKLVVSQDGSQVRAKSSSVLSILAEIRSPRPKVRLVDSNKRSCDCFEDRANLPVRLPKKARAPFNETDASLLHVLTGPAKVMQVVTSGVQGCAGETKGSKEEHPKDAAATHPFKNVTEALSLCVEIDLMAAIVETLQELPTCSAVKKVSHRGMISLPSELAQQQHCMVFVDAITTAGGSIRQQLLQQNKYVLADAGSWVYASVLGKLMSMSKNLCADMKRVFNLSTEHQADIIEATLARLRERPRSDIDSSRLLALEAVIIADMRNELQDSTESASLLPATSRVEVAHPTATAILPREPINLVVKSSGDIHSKELHHIISSEFDRAVLGFISKWGGARSTTRSQNSRYRCMEFFEPPDGTRTWYHGTNLEGLDGIVSSGLLLLPNAARDYNRSNPASGNAIRGSEACVSLGVSFEQAQRGYSGPEALGECAYVAIICECTPVRNCEGILVLPRRNRKKGASAYQVPRISVCRVWLDICHPYVTDQTCDESVHRGCPMTRYDFAGYAVHYGARLQRMRDWDQCHRDKMEETDASGHA